MIVSGNSKDEMYIGDGVGDLDPDQNIVVLNITAPDDKYRITLLREITSRDIEMNEYFLNSKSPGFHLEWRYNTHKVYPDVKFQNNLNLVFRR